MQKGYLVLENGTVFTGELLGYRGEAQAGELVFNTGMNGYQEAMTDPSYAGQILVFTYPSIGNYGFGDYGFESEKPHLQGLVVKEKADLNGHYQSRWNFEEFMEKYSLNCLAGIDTRKLTRILRVEGTMGAVITHQPEPLDELLKKAAAGRALIETDLVSRVSCKETAVYGEGKTRIVLWDFGSKKHIIAALTRRKCQVIAVPASTEAESIMALEPDGVVLTNGPGNPEIYTGLIREIKKIIGRVPLLGICMGHQLLALASGASTFKMKFGHRGANHTVKDLRNGKCFITSQNHSFAIEPASLEGTGLAASFTNLNDSTIEGLYHHSQPAFSVQFHPEAAPGPQDTEFIFDEFIHMTAKFSPGPGL